VSDINLFRLQGGKALELPASAEQLEKSLQAIFESNLEALLGVRFVRSEMVVEGGRLDSIGIDENNAPVVIEYKRRSGENVINQGLFYLDWLVTHRGDFEMLVLERFGQAVATSLSWSGARLICIANDFTRYDLNAVRQMNRPIDLIRYRRFDSDLLLLEQLTPARGQPSLSNAPVAQGAENGPGPKPKYKTITTQMGEAPPELKALLDEADDYLSSLSDDVARVVTDYYVAYRRMKNFATLEVRNQKKKLLVYLVLDPDSVKLEDGFTRDMRQKGHFGSGDVEVTIASKDDLERAKPLFERAHGET
jgi:predicted transport protein